jgi:cellulose synthase operon protein C
VPLDSPRIAELRRRVQADPSSIAFAQLAEEYRRGGSFADAVEVCRAGLERHPAYLSARVTLGRALTELGQLDEAELEFDLVLGTAPDNLAAIRGVAEISQRRGHLHVALAHYERALSLARHDPDLEETVAAIAREIGGQRRVPPSGMSFEEAESELVTAAARIPLAAADGPEIAVPESPPTPRGPEGTNAASSGSAPAPSPFDFDSLLASLGQSPSAPAPPIVEAWLSGSALTPTASVNAPPPAPEPSAGPPADLAQDILSQIEQDLRRFESEGARTAPAVAAEPSAAAPAPAPAEQVAIDELERWLAVLQETRSSRPNA